MPRKRSVCAIAATALLAVAVGCTDTTDATSADPQFAHSGAGGGSHWDAQVVGGSFGFDDDPGIADRDVNSLAIQAKLFSGSAEGSIQVSRLLVHPDPVLELGEVARFFNLHVDVLCMEVISATRAVIGGVVTHGEVDIGLAGLGPPPGTIVDATGIPGKLWVRVIDNRTFDFQLGTFASVADLLATCTDDDEPPEAFFRTIRGNLRIMDRR